MPQLDIGNATASTLSTDITNYVVDSEELDSSTSDETVYQNHDWSKQLGYFENVPDLKSAITMKAVWVCGKGYTCNSETKIILDHIDGWGKDTFSDILFNMEILKRIGGDAYCEIIRKDGIIINLKPLDPGKMRIIVGKDGRIKRYEQITAEGKTIKFKPEEIFHLCNERTGDQIHGTSVITALEKTILADEENLDNIIKVFKRQAKPMILWKLGTDDSTKISAFITKMDAATNKGENLYVPYDDDTISFDVIQVPISPLTLEWGNYLRNRFYRTIGMPQIVPGAGGQSTESESKVIYLAFEQIVQKEQADIEKQIWSQLQLELNLNPPTSLSENLQTDQTKEGQNAGLNFQPQDLNANATI
jgi:hypothetical protein